MALNSLQNEWLQRVDRDASEHVAVPKAAVAAGGEYIVWGPGLPLDKGWYDWGGDFEEGSPSRGCLSRFLALVDAPDDRIADFARKRGALGFCKEHRLPGAHASCAPALSLQWQDSLWYVDRIEDWRALARRLRATVSLAHSALTGGTQRLEDFQAALDLPASITSAIWLVKPQVERAAATERAAAVVSHHLDTAEIRPLVRWDQRRRKFVLIPVFSPNVGNLPDPSFDWPENSLYRVLLAQLATAVTMGELVQCRSCGVAFDWEDAGYERTPRYDRAAYCTDWCRAEARREQKAGWKRRRDRRLREQRKG